MKKYILIVLSILTISTLAIALPTPQKTTLSWDAPTTNTDGTPITDLGGYKVYWKQQAQTAYTDTQSKDVGNVLTANIAAVMGTQPKGTYCFVATAYDTEGNESDFSNEVCASFFVRKNPPANLELN